jgi:hypothetical protein
MFNEIDAFNQLGVIKNKLLGEDISCSQGLFPCFRTRNTNHQTFGITVEPLGPFSFGYVPVISD